MANPSREEVQREIIKQANELGVNPALAMAVFFRESSFRADVVSSAGAIGVAQLMPATARKWNVDPWDYRQNIYGGLMELRDLVRRYGDNLPMVLRRYGGFVTKDPTRYIVAVMQSVLEYTYIEVVIPITGKDMLMLSKGVQ